MKTWNSLLPRSLGIVLSIAAVGGLMAYSFSQEAPVGRVLGKVILGDSGKPLAGVRITLASAEAEPDEPGALYDGNEPVLKRFRTRTDAKGEWSLSGVDVGVYHVSAASSAHSIGEQTIVVMEDETVNVPLKLKRSQPDLQVTQHQHEFLPSEEVTLPIHGYVDGKKTVGTDLLQIRVYQARLANVLANEKAAQGLGQVSNEYDRAVTLPSALMHPVGTAAPRLAHTYSVPLKKADLEGFYHERVKLGKLPAGLYLVDVKHGSATTCAEMLVSDTSLVVKKTTNQLLAYAVDSKTGVPRPGAAIQLFKEGKKLAAARTDKDGLAKIALTSSGDSGDRLLTLVSFGANEATVGQYDYQGEDDESRGQYVVHAYTDRPVYRPGGTVSYKGIVRHVIQTGLRYSVPTNQPVEIEVRDPSGSRIKGSRLTTNDYGSFHGSFELSPEAPTGDYLIVCTIAGEEHTTDVTVTSYKKPEFSATVTSSVKQCAFGEPVDMAVESTYYFGAPVAGAKVHYTLMRSPDWSALYTDDAKEMGEGAEGDTGEDSDYADGEYNDGSGEVVREGDLTLDNNGHGVIQFTPELHEPTEEENSTSEDKPADPFNDEAQDQKYTVSLDVTDAANREVEAEGDVLVTAGDFRLGLQTDGYFASPGKPATVTMVATDFDDKPIIGKAIDLTCGYRTWDQDSSVWVDGKLTSYHAITGNDGRAKISLTLETEGILYLKASAIDSKDREVTATQSWWIAGDEGGDYDGQYDTLSILTDHKRYKAGDIVKALINSEVSGGTALVTVEGSRLFREWLVPLKHRSTALQVPLTDDYGPNVSLAVCYVRDKKFATSAVPLRVQVPKRTIDVGVTADREKLQPGEEVTYNISTSDSKGKPVPADVSLAVVDESIFAIQEDDPGALRRAFYPLDPNSVQTDYSFEPLYLGDVNKSDPAIIARKKFLDTAFWRPDVQTDQNGKASVKVKLPDNLTSWRATAVAQTLGTAFGWTKGNVIVSKDFFVRLEAPRFLSEGDHTQITALVHNNTGQDQEAKVKFEAGGLSVDGPDTQTVSVPTGTVARVEWPITAMGPRSTAQGATLKLSAWTQNGAAKPWTDGVENTVPVRPQGRERIVTEVGQIDAAMVNRNLDIDASAQASSTKVTLRIDPSVSDSMVGALKYLTGYPYGCTEQTMSRILPDILVQRILRLQNNSAPEAKKLAAGLPTMVLDGLTRLKRYQHSEGAWGWWENDDDDPWMTAYVLYGLSEAQRSGYTVDQDMISNGREAGVKLLARPRKKEATWEKHNFEDTQAFLLYALSQVAPNDKEMATIRAARGALGSKGLTSQALGYLVLFDKELRSNAALPELKGQLEADGSQLRFWKSDGHEEWSDWDDQTATAIGLRALIAAEPQNQDIKRVALWLMAQRKDDAWGNTRDTSWTLAALCDYMRLSKIGAPTGTLKISLNGKVQRLVDLKTEPPGEIVMQLPAGEMRSSGNVLQFDRQGGAEPVFFATQVRQILTGGASGSPPPSNIPISVSREYRRLESAVAGTASWSVKSRPTNNLMAQSDRIRVRLTFVLPTDMSYVLMEDPFPAGMETTERGSAEEDEDSWDNWWSETDVRDDHIAFFARHMSKGTHVIEYNLRAQTAGTFVAPPTLLQAMYATNCSGESSEAQVTIN